MTLQLPLVPSEICSSCEAEGVTALDAWTKQKGLRAASRRRAWCSPPPAHNPAKWRGRNWNATKYMFYGNFVGEAATAH